MNALARNGKRCGSRPTSAQVLRHNKLQNLARQCIQRLLAKLFTEMTGLRPSVLWALPVSVTPAANKPSLDCPARRRRARAGPAVEVSCRRCFSEEGQRALRSGGVGHQFVGACGLRNFWIPLQAQGLHLGTVILQARGSSGGRRPTESAARGVSAPLAASLPPVSAAEFRRAAGLLQLIVHDATQTALAEERKEQLGRLAQRVQQREQQSAKLRQRLQRALPGGETKAARVAPGSHAEQLVQVMLDYLHEHYTQPLTLKEMADHASLNSAYASALFSQAVGMSFKQYLAVVRLESAKTQLSDPTRRVSEIAYAVGYSDPNRFRLAFKQWTGLSPSAWRQVSAGS